ncbi:MAG: DUF4105 domain-containing protein [Muribaculaceae bacterium]|nr:DUF4105 domain-containing protein [Muribaculaceae bacterium]
MKRIVLILTIAAFGLLGRAETVVSLLTALPGEEIYQLEGHTGLRIRNDRGSDMVVNWGVFDFNSPNFVYRFVSGQTDYECWAYPTEYFLNSYKAEGREVVEQVLDLDSAQVQRVIDLVSINLQPENRVYRYNYVLDNCATRPLAIIEQAVGRPLLSDEPANTTFRAEMERYHSGYPWYQFGIDLALGRGLDRPISRREAAFAPVELMNQLANTDIVTETRSYGKQAIGHGEWHTSPLSLSILILISALIVSLTSDGRSFDTLYFGIAAITGFVITFLVFVSTHEASSPNLLLLWLNPFCALGAILPWIKKAKKVEMWYFFVNFALLIILAIAAPVLGRAMNAAFWPLIAADAVRSLANILKCRNALKSNT